MQALMYRGTVVMEVKPTCTCSGWPNSSVSGDISRLVALLLEEPLRLLDRILRRGEDEVASLQAQRCTTVTLESRSQVSGGAGRIVQLASLCCRHSRTSSVICSTLRRHQVTTHSTSHKVVYS